MHSALASPAAWWATLAAAAVVLLLPLLIVDVPPLLDYPNHLARAYVLAFGERDPVLSQMYAPRWDIIPNLAMDLVLPPAMRLMPVHVAGRLVLGVALLLPLLGAILYSRATFGERSYWPIASALMAYNALFLLGFVNFTVAAGLALVAAAAWVGLRDRRPAVAVAATALLACALFFSHIFGLVFCAILIGSHELVALWREWRGGRPPLRRALARGAAVALAFGPVAVLYLNTALSETGGIVLWKPPGEKIKNLSEPFMNYYAVLDRATALLVYGLVAAMLLLRAAVLSAAGAVALAACLALYMATPYAMKGGAFVDARFPIMIGLLVFAAVLPRLPRRAALPVGLAVAALFVLRMGVLAATWQQHRTDLAELREAIAPVAPGSRVLVVTASPAAAARERWWQHRQRVVAGFFRTDLHLGALLLVERRAFWPLMFALRAQQPIEVLPPYDRLTLAGGVPPPYQMLEASDRPGPWQDDAPYMADWQSSFDHVLLLSAGAAAAGDLADLLPGRLALLRSTGMAALFRVRPPGAGADEAPRAGPATLP